MGGVGGQDQRALRQVELQAPLGRFRQESLQGGGDDGKFLRQEAVIQEEGVHVQAGAVHGEVAEAGNHGVQGRSEEQGPQGIALLDPGGRPEAVVAELEHSGDVNATEKEMIQQRADVIHSVTLCEIRQFHTARRQDFKQYMQRYLQAQMDFHMKLVADFEKARKQFDDLPF